MWKCIIFLSPYVSQSQSLLTDTDRCLLPRWLLLLCFSSVCWIFPSPHLIPPPRFSIPPSEPVTRNEWGLSLYIYIIARVQNLANCRQLVPLPLPPPVAGSGEGRMQAVYHRGTYTHAHPLPGEGGRGGILCPLIYLKTVWHGLLPCVWF
jgi:hypothetical protein